LNKYLFLVNPAAGKGKALKTVPVIEKYFKEIGNSEYEIILSQAPKHLIDIAKRSCNHDFTHIIAVGGDGTVNEIINGLEINSNIYFALLPVGSGNDFARSLHLPKDVISNLKLILNADAIIKSVNITEVDIIDYNSTISSKTFIINSLGIGFDALVADLNQKNKIFSGLLSYIVAVLYAISSYRAICIELLINNQKINGSKLLIAVGNGKTSGGGFFLNPDAEIDDDLLDICIIDSLTKLNMIRHLPKALLNKIKEVKEVSLHRFTTANISLKKPCLVHGDGEIISRNAVGITIKLLKDKIKVITGYIH